MIKIMVVDDHPIVLRGLISLIDEAKDFDVVAAVESAERLFEKLVEHNGEVDVVLLDVSLPGMNGYDALLKLRTCYPNISVLMLSAMSESSFADKVLSVGAKGFLNKESAPEDLVDAIRMVASGKMFNGNPSNNFLSGKERNRMKLLSTREFQVLMLLGQGKTVGEIAKDVNLSVKTISTYRSRILAKLNLKNTSEIIKFCMNNSIV